MCRFVAGVGLPIAIPPSWQAIQVTHDAFVPEVMAGALLLVDPTQAIHPRDVTEAWGAAHQGRLVLAVTPSSDCRIARFTWFEPHPPGVRAGRPRFYLCGPWGMRAEQPEESGVYDRLMPIFGILNPSPGVGFATPDRKPHGRS